MMCASCGSSRGPLEASSGPLWAALKPSRPQGGYLERSCGLFGELLGATGSLLGILETTVGAPRALRF